MPPPAFKNLLGTIRPLCMLAKTWLDILILRIRLVYHLTAGFILKVMLCNFQLLKQEQDTGTLTCLCVHAHTHTLIHMHACTHKHADVPWSWGRAPLLAAHQARRGKGAGSECRQVLVHERHVDISGVASGSPARWVWSSTSWAFFAPAA